MGEQVKKAFILACLFVTITLFIILSLNPIKFPQMQNPPMTSVRQVAPMSANTTQVTRKSFVILVYTRFFGTKEWIKIDDGCPSIPNNNCTRDMFDVTYDKQRFSESELVIFHARNMPALDHLKTMLKVKPSWQFWIYFLKESPNVTPNTAPLNGMFDFTMTYRADSDFSASYGSYEEIPFANVNTTQQDFSLGKTKLVSWIVSNCGSNLRKSFVHELQKYIPVDVYGSCSRQFGPPRSCDRRQASICKNIIKQYKFYLSFENALCEDYITEKYWKHLGDENIVPVVLGGANYTKLAIPGSYINVMDFKTVKDFADYLQYLDKNNTAYNQYFKWRQKYKSRLSTDESYICPICKKLTLETQLKQLVTNRYKDLTDYWVKQGKCNKKNDLVKKLWS